MLIDNLWFWIVMMLVAVIGVVAECLVSRKYKEYVPAILLSVFTFFAAFRYGLVIDYESYCKLFNEINIDSKIEPVFKVIVIALRETCFAEQMMFVVYAVISSIFLWKGMKYYCRSTKQLTFMIALFAIFSDGGWWFSLIYIRQWLAVCIFIWSTQYIVEGKLRKYLLAMFLVTACHYSGGILVFAYVCRYMNFKRYIYALCGLGSIVLAYIDVFPEIMRYIMVITGFTRYIGYFSWGKSDLGTGIGVLLLGVLWCFILYNKEKLDYKIKILANLYLIGALFMVLTYTSGPIFRLRSYFQFIGFMTLPFIIDSFKSYRRLLTAVIIILYTGMFIGHAYKVQFPPSNVNIKYEMNFKLLK